MVPDIDIQSCMHEVAKLVLYFHHCRILTFQSGACLEQRPFQRALKHAPSLSKDFYWPETALPRHRVSCRLDAEFEPWRATTGRLRTSKSGTMRKPCCTVAACLQLPQPNRIQTWSRSLPVTTYTYLLPPNHYLHRTDRTPTVQFYNPYVVISFLYTQNRPLVQQGNQYS
jgi:hypothetical protein